MRNFCQIHSPYLYDTLLSSITRQNGRATSKNHTTLQEQRIVGLLHTLAYFRYLNQVNVYSKTYSPPDQLLTPIGSEVKRLVSPSCLCQENYTLHIYGCISCFFRSQKTSHLQKQAGMFLSMHGLTRSAQTLGRVLGFSQGTRMNDIFKQQQLQAKQHRQLMDNTVETACKVILNLKNIKIYTPSK